VVESEVKKSEASANIKDVDHSETESVIRRKSLFNEIPVLLRIWTNVLKV
jgi:hypothetical protein